MISKLVVEQVSRDYIPLFGAQSHIRPGKLNAGHIEKSDAVQIAFLMLVAGNATMVNMINLVSHAPA